MTEEIGLKNQVAIITGGARSNILLIIELKKAKKSSFLSSIKLLIVRG